MDQTQEVVEGTIESVIPYVSGPSGSDRSEHDSTKALVKISQDMARVLDRLTALRVPIDSIRKLGVEEFHGTSLEESNWIELPVQRRLCPIFVKLWIPVNGT